VQPQQSLMMHRAAASIHKRDKRDPHTGILETSTNATKQTLLSQQQLQDSYYSSELGQVHLRTKLGTSS
jgi:hypothetical protein